MRADARNTIWWDQVNARLMMALSVRPAAAQNFRSKIVYEIYVVRRSRPVFSPLTTMLKSFSSARSSLIFYFKY